MARPKARSPSSNSSSGKCTAAPRLICPRHASSVQLRLWPQRECVRAPIPRKFTASRLRHPFAIGADAPPRSKLLSSPRTLARAPFHVARVRGQPGGSRDRGRHTDGAPWSPHIVPVQAPARSDAAFRQTGFNRKMTTCPTMANHSPDRGGCKEKTDALSPHPAQFAQSSSPPFRKQSCRFANKRLSVDFRAAWWINFRA